MHMQVCHGHQVSHTRGPLHELEARCGKLLSKASILPLSLVFKTVKVKMRDAQRLAPEVALVGLHNGISGAFDSPSNA